MRIILVTIFIALLSVGSLRSQGIPMFGEALPVFPGCENESVAKQDRCTQERMIYAARRNFKYPKKAVNKELSGKVVMIFKVSTKGKVCKLRVIERNHRLLNKAAKKAVKELPDFTPGYQDGKSVPVYFTIPFNITLS